MSGQISGIVNDYGDRLVQEVDGHIEIDEQDFINDPDPVDASSRLRDIRIKPLSSGFMVTVGCQSIAVETNKSLIKALTLYLENPSDFEKRWFSKDVRNKLENIQ